jgi:hypothetical protein
VTAVRIGLLGEANIEDKKRADRYFSSNQLSNI